MTTLLCGVRSLIIVHKPTIILHTDKSVSIEHVVKIMDIAYRNKYKIVLATKPN